jgi:hypothetical protein
MGDISDEYVVQFNTWTARNWVRSCVTWGRGYHAVGQTALQLEQWSHHCVFGVQVAINEMRRSFLSVCNSCPHHDTLSTMNDSSSDIKTLHTVPPISVIHVESQFVCWHHISPPSEGPLGVSVSPCKTIPARTGERSNLRWGRQTYNSSSQRQLRTVWAEMRLLLTPTVSSAIRVAG